MMVENAIILAAGRSLQLDGKNKVLIKHPVTRKTILDYAIEAFAGKRVTVVVGYGALKIMERYPQLNYVLNEDWATTNNAMSLGLALLENMDPTYVVSGDMFFNRELISEMDNGKNNIVLTQNRDNRMLSSIHCAMGQQEKIIETYQGPIRSVSHPEAMGLFKLSDEKLLGEWRNRYLCHSNLFVAQALPCTEETLVYAHDVGRNYFKEINSAADYLRLMKEALAK